MKWKDLRNFTYGQLKLFIHKQLQDFNILDVAVYVKTLDTNTPEVKSLIKQLNLILDEHKINLDEENFINSLSELNGNLVTANAILDILGAISSAIKGEFGWEILFSVTSNSIITILSQLPNAKNSLPISIYKLIDLANSALKKFLKL